MSNYNKSLRPWVVYRLDSHLSAWVEVKRFKLRADAESYKVLLKRLRNDLTYDVAFDSQLPQMVAAQ